MLRDARDRVRANRAVARALNRPVPEPGPGQLLLKVHACGVCRTDLHLLDGEVDDRPAAARARPPDRRRRRRRGPPRRRAVARLDLRRVRATAPAGARTSARAPASPAATSTAASPSTRSPTSASASRSRDGYPDAAGRAAALRRPDRLPRAADRGRRASGSASTASAPRRTSSARSPSTRAARVFAFTRPGDEATQAFARELGAVWAGASDEAPPVPLDAAIIFAPVGALVPHALRALAPGGTVVCAGIHMSDIPAFPYELLWERAHAALGRQPHPRATARSSSRWRRRCPSRTRVTRLPARATPTEALEDLRAGRFAGAAVVSSLARRRRARRCRARTSCRRPSA